jgi:N-acetylglucosaminylphosphatidylinositol deacetylase
MDFYLACLIIIPALLFLFIPKISGNLGLLKGINKILLVIAHPDDECMFFSPAIIQLSKTAKVEVLCMSTGNHLGLGSIREMELQKSCKRLNVSKCYIINDPYFIR